MIHFGFHVFFDSIVFWNVPKRSKYICEMYWIKPTMIGTDLIFFLSMLKNLFRVITNKIQISRLFFFYIIMSFVSTFKFKYYTKLSVGEIRHISKLAICRRYGSIWFIRHTKPSLDFDLYQHHFQGHISRIPIGKLWPDTFTLSYRGWVCIPRSF